MGGRAASEHWPLDGIAPDGAVLDAHGYLDDTVDAAADPRRASRAMLSSLSPTSTAPDTAGHVHGPDDARAMCTTRSISR